MTKIEITEDRPLSYTCHDGTPIVVSVAGPVEKIYTLTVGGERRLSDVSEDYVRYVARAEAAARNERWDSAMKAAEDERQFCRKGVHLCTPAVTLTFDGGTRRLHWCAEHASDAERYRADADTPQIFSPLAEGERQSSGLAGGGPAANAMSAPVREMLDSACTAFDGLVWRGRQKDGNYPLTMLRAAARRGWLELDHEIRPSWGRLTDAGRRALAAELARTGGAR